MKIVKVKSEPEEQAWRLLKVAGIALLGAVTFGILGVVLARDQMDRHRRDLFSPHALRRLAALGFLRAHPTVDHVLLLRDFLAWEEKPLLRKRASATLARMEEQLATVDDGVGGV